MLISRRRAAARASIRWDRLKQTMSSSRPEPASSASNGSRSAGRMSETPPAPGSRAMCTFGASPGRVSVGWSARNRCRTTFTFASAAARATPGRRRPMSSSPPGLGARQPVRRPPQRRLHGRRHPEIGGPFHPCAGKARRPHAHDGVGRAVDGQHRPHHRGLAAEAPLPVAMAQHHHRVGSGGRVIVTSEQAPAVGRQPQHLEVVGADRPAEREIAGCFPAILSGLHHRGDLARLLRGQVLERLVLARAAARTADTRTDSSRPGFSGPPSVPWGPRRT